MDANKKKLAKLHSLAQLDVDAIGTYDAALERVDVPMLREQLSGFRADHERHVRTLNDFIVRYGGEAVEMKPDIKGAVLKGFTAVTSMMGNEAALVAMIGNEELTTRSYQAALKLEWSPEERTVIESHFADEQRHLAWIKDAAKSRRWADQEAHP
jgi:rubrerythrin